METIILIIIGFFLLGIIAIWILLRNLKKKKKIAELERTPPARLMEELEFAEEQMKGGIKEDGTTTNPYTILWEIAKRRRVGEELTATPRTEQGTSIRELRSEFRGQQDVQTRTIENLNNNSNKPREHKQNSIRTFLSRIRRK